MMTTPPSDPELLKLILEPLLEDFQYWFGRSRQLLENNEIDFLGAEQQADLLLRLTTAQQQVSASQMLFRATDGQVGVDPGVMAPWHRLLMECWGVAMRFRQSQHPQPNA
jgi:hypothetical protein